MTHPTGASGVALAVVMAVVFGLALYWMVKGPRPPRDDG